jgi:hypothetical protein
MYLSGEKNPNPFRRDDAIGKRRSEYEHGEVNIVVLAACVQSNCWNAVCGLPGQTTFLVQTCEKGGQVDKRPTVILTRRFKSVGIIKLYIVVLTWPD